MGVGRGHELGAAADREDPVVVVGRGAHERADSLGEGRRLRALLRAPQRRLRALEARACDIGGRARCVDANVEQRCMPFGDKTIGEQRRLVDLRVQALRDRAQ